MKYNLGFLMVILFFLFSVLPGKKYRGYLALAMLPLIYYIAGGYVWIFLGIFTVYNLYHEKGIPRYSFPLLLVITIAAVIYISKTVLFFQPVEHLLRYPLPPLPSAYYLEHVFFILLAVYLIFYPLIIKISFLPESKKRYTRTLSRISAFTVILLTIAFSFKLYNPQAAKVLKLQKLVFNQEWEAAIELHETSPSRNLIGQYFYNIALSETDQLCDRLFSGRHDFASRSLILPWGDEHMRRGAYFYYATGLINEAHRWAYESMVVNGYQPQNIKFLVKTNLINQNFRIAEKYIDVLKNTLYYSQWAKEYEKMLYEPELVRTHPELGMKTRLLPEENFFIQMESPQNNIPLLLQANPGNYRAFEYQIAWLMLEKNVEVLVNQLQNMREMGYTRIPGHIEEAVLAYYNSTGNFPDLGGLAISNETQLRFGDYIEAYTSLRQSAPALIEERMRDNFGDTFWFYFHFK